MSEGKEKILSKARKLKALAVGGDSGEKDNAERMYQEYIKLHNINDCEINSDMSVRYFTDIVNDNERDIVCTVLYSINPFSKPSYNAVFDVTVDLDEEDYVEAKEKVSYFITLWRLEVNALKSAFSLRHKDFLRPDAYAMDKWRENKTKGEDNVEDKVQNLIKLSNKIKIDLEKNQEAVINEIFNTKDQDYMTAFNIDRSVAMSELLLLANYIRANKKINEYESKNK
jgi:hypothetical protein